jgi:hypothetical protein
MKTTGNGQQTTGNGRDGLLTVDREPWTDPCPILPTACSVSTAESFSY